MGPLSPLFAELLAAPFPELFPDPELYRFDRFVDDKGRPARFFKGGRRVTMPFLPFGGGPRQCIGGPLAMEILRITLPAIAQRFRLTARSSITQMTRW